MTIVDISASLSSSTTVGGSSGSGGAFGAGAFAANTFAAGAFGAGDTGGANLVGDGVLLSTVSSIAIITAQLSAFAYSSITIPSLTSLSASLTGAVFMSATIGGQSTLSGDLSVLAGTSLEATISSSSSISATLSALANGSAVIDGGGTDIDVTTKRRAGGAPGYGGWWGSTRESEKEYQKQYAKLFVRVDFTLDGVENVEGFSFDTYPVVMSARITDAAETAPEPTEPMVIEMVSMDLEEVRITARIKEAA